MRYTDYLYAFVPSFCFTGVVAQILPDLTWLQGLEKLGIVGIMGLGIVFFVMERRSFIARSGTRLEGVEKRLSALETQVTTSNDKMVSLLDQQLAELREIKTGQQENFSRMWQLTLGRLETGGRRPEDFTSNDNGEIVVYD
jgi:uncharacterized coiled-coil protein SlyX